MSIRSSASRGAPLGALAAAVIILAFLAGCGNTPAQKDREGAVITADRVAATAGEIVKFDSTGSRLEGVDACPEHVSFFVAGKTGPAADVYDPKTVSTPDGCKLADMKVPLTMQAGVPGQTRDEEVSVLVEGTSHSGSDEGTLYDSTAKMTVRVATPALGSPQPVSTPVSQTTPTTTTPAPTSGGGGGGGGGTAGCDTSGVTSGADPTGAIVTDPESPVEGGATQFDASEITDADGRVTEYRWDYDGNGTWDETGYYPQSPDGTTATSYSHTYSSATTNQTVCLEIEIYNATTSAYEHKVVSLRTEVNPPGWLQAKPFTTSDDGHGNVTFTVPSSTSADSVAINYDWDSADPSDPSNTFSDTQSITPGGAAATFTHKYTATGTHEVKVLYADSTSSEGSIWTEFVDVPNVTTRVPPAGLTTATMAERPWRHRYTAHLRFAAGKIVSTGKVGFGRDGLSIRRAIVRGRLTGRLPRRLRRAPAGLRALYRSDWVMRFTGRRVLLSAEDWGASGSATILARSRSDRRTMLCLRLTTDGATAAGTRWRLIGATGRAAGFRASGVADPPLLKGTAPRAAITALVGRGARHGLGSCKGLVRYLPTRARHRARHNSRRDGHR